MTKAMSRPLSLLAVGLTVLLAACGVGGQGTLVPVPPVSGLSLPDAERALRDAGFSSSVATVPYPARAPEVVVAQDPAQGQPKPAGTRVRLIVAVPGPSHVVLGDYVGQPWYHAVQELTAQGLVSRIVSLPSSAGTAGLVLGQTPKAGSDVPAGATVILRIPRGR